MSGEKNENSVEAAAERASVLLHMDRLREAESRIRNEIEKVTEHLDSTIQHSIADPAASDHQSLPADRSGAAPSAPPADPSTEF
jgi:hypothetical protein